MYVVEPIPETNHSVAPDTTTSITNANIYPLLIESDQLLAYRDKRFPGLPAGTVSATAYGARDLTPTGTTTARGGGRGGFTPSHFPLVEVTATSQSRASAGTVAAATAQAFVEYVDAQQTSQAVPKAQRIDVEILKAPPLGVAAGVERHPEGLPGGHRHDARLPHPAVRARRRDAGGGASGRPDDQLSSVVTRAR